ncbi:MAG: hypothetical protein IPJ74_08630 [Saprospiraceae bacterium]|nr:hypothetical protein [Saprospiraceae bacterium]
MLREDKFFIFKAAAEAQKSADYILNSKGGSLEKAKQEFSFMWQDIPIQVSYCPDYSEEIKKIQGYMLAHIEVNADTRLPITETGYRSIWLSDAEVQEQGGAVALVRLFLDTAAKEKEWQDYMKEKKQLSLFKSNYPF